MNTVRVIKTQRDYDAADARLRELLDMEVIKSGSAEESELELLTLVIQSYERAQVSTPRYDPISAIQFRMEQQRLTRKDLELFIGSGPKVSEVMNRKRPLSLSMIRKLHKGLHIPAEVLIQDDGGEINLADDPELDYTKFPLLEMHSRGLFPNFTGGVKQLKEYAEDLIRSFLRDVGEQRNHALLRAPLSQNGARTMDEAALRVWQLCVLRKAKLSPATAKYNEGLINTSWLRDLAKLSAFERGPKLAEEYLRNYGILLIIEPHYEKTYLDGAALLDGERPVVALTLRHDRIDNFWFALLHECVHVWKHLQANKPFIADNLEDKTQSSEEEKEADDGAEEALIPEVAWKNAAVRQSHSVEDAIALAHELRISPAIVAGRVRKETGDWRLLSGLISGAGKVRPLFEDQFSAVKTN